MYFLYGKHETMKRFKALNVQSNSFVDRLVYATRFKDENLPILEAYINSLRESNRDWEFKTVHRGHREYTAKTRAKRAAKMLLSNDYSKLSSREYDGYFECGDGENIVKMVVQILRENGINSHEELGYYAQRNSSPEWWSISA